MYDYIMSGFNTKTFNRFCAFHKCQYYIEWEVEHGKCFSCKKIGQSYDITEYPADCQMLADIKLEEELYLKKMMWKRLHD